MPDDLYNLLNVSKDASQEEIKKAFKKKAMECHPDKTNGDKSKEELFKKINDAYGVLSNPEKRQMYDQFGIVDGQPGGGGPGGGGIPPDFADILNGMFGGMGMGGPGRGGRAHMGPGGFSFVFMGDEGGGMSGDPHDDAFHPFFGMGGGPRPRPQQPRRADMIEVEIDINDIFYGKTKKVEFELLDQCNKCEGTGAADPSFIVKCMTCNGAGKVHQQMGPFFMQSATCPSCAGQGSTIKNNKHCLTCKGKKTVFHKKAFELKLPKGITNNHEVRMDKKGSFDEQLKGYRDMIFKFKYNIQPPYSLDEDMNVHFELTVPIEDLLSGFERKVQIYNEEFTIVSEHYFNPNRKISLDGLGVQNLKKNKTTDLILHVKVEYGECEKLIKYNDIIRKVLKKPSKEESQQENTSSEPIPNRIVLSS